MKSVTLADLYLTVTLADLYLTGNLAISAVSCCQDPPGCSEVQCSTLECSVVQCSSSRIYIFFFLLQSVYIYSVVQWSAV